MDKGFQDTCVVKHDSRRNENLPAGTEPTKASPGGQTQIRPKFFGPKMRLFTHAPPETLRNNDPPLTPTHASQNKPTCMHTVPSRPRAGQMCIICIASATLQSTPVDRRPTCFRYHSAPSRRALQSRELSETKRVQSTVSPCQRQQRGNRADMDRGASLQQACASATRQR